MRSVMGFQGATLDKASIASLNSAMIRSLVSMYSLMSLKVGLAVETLREVVNRKIRARL